MRKKLMGIIGIGVGIAMAGAAPASASLLPAGVTFDWAPSLLHPAISDPDISANDIGVLDYADVVLTDATHFNENAVLKVTSFDTSGVTSPNYGPSSNYGFYITVNAKGTTQGIPANLGDTSGGVFTDANYTFWANPGGQPTVTINPGGTPTIGGNSNAFPIFGGTLISGVDSLQKTGNGTYQAGAGLHLTLTACTAAGQLTPTNDQCQGDESDFFVDPLAPDITVVTSAFTASDTVTSVNPPNIDINGGGGNITFAVPEPAALALLGSALVGLAFVRRRRAGS